MINARAEGVAERPSFRSSFRRRRCLVVADGFYEWQKQPGGKLPFYFHLRDRQPFGFAGLWESWDKHHETGPLETFTIITTEPNELVGSVHQRMPVILRPDGYQQWLDPDFSERQPLEDLLRSYPSEEMRALSVSTRVNNPVHDDLNCIAPA
jgi:putative SOS response-associated peptidase YedK